MPRRGSLQTDDRNVAQKANRPEREARELSKVHEKHPVAMRLGETPVPIPNTMVKTQAADGTMLETAWESRWLPDSCGGVAQLGEHLPCKQGVKSSNLSISIC